ncbi:MAG: class I SAM-dependent methyltransferase [Rhodocyclaceae bacterium]|nr:MAG: class I SAM-dependent methyltransferase [Rhodocyclaceae bacterium]
MWQENVGQPERSISAASDYQPSAKPYSFVDQVFGAERLLLERMLESLGNPSVQIELWDGQLVPQNQVRAPVPQNQVRVLVTDRGDAPVARMIIRDRGALLKLISNPEFWFGEMYAAGRIDVEGDLAEFIETVYRSLPRLNQDTLGKRLLAPFSDARRNSLPKARSNIHHHYDIGNEFYRLWLDQQMVYTCAYFPVRSMPLEDAQIAKMDHLCRKLQLQPGETVVEAGSGWGTLALHMARQCGVKVKAYNISREQVAYSRERARDTGLDDRVEFIEDDYRNIRGDFDVFVSVGMLEHVGVDHYPELGAVLDRSLKHSGRGLIHSIGRDYPCAMNPWIERRIFPGASPPSLSEMMRIFEPFGFSVLDVENLRLHYARTLEHWLERYENAADRVAEMFDPAFVRAWRLYLAGSLAAFRSGAMQLFQVGFARSGYNQIPWTRQHQYPA